MPDGIMPTTCLLLSSAGTLPPVQAHERWLAVAAWAEYPAGPLNPRPGRALSFFPVQARAGFAENRGRGGDNYELQWLYR